MFGFHRRSRSLIPVADMEKSEKTEHLCVREKSLVELEEEEGTMHTPRQKRNLTMIYLLFLAEAMMAASLSSQIAILVPSPTSCLSMDTAFLRSILEGTYYLGSAMGLFWGCAADKWGRRRVAMLGLGGMLTCCISMGFAASFQAFALLRFIAGAVSSASTMSGLAMLADLTHGSKKRTAIVSRLPFISVCGRAFGPMVAHLWHTAFDGSRFPVFAMFPTLSGQIACSGLVFTIAVAEACLLDETLPSMQVHRHDEEEADGEKAAFLGQSLSNDSDEALNITIIEALQDTAPLPSKIGLAQILAAPSVLLLLASFSILELHSSLYEILLPHIGHTATRDGGMGISCGLLESIATVIGVVAAARVLRLVPWIVSMVGSLTMYRRTSVMFPVLYAVVPLLLLAVNAIGGPQALVTTVSTIAMYFKTTLAGAAKVLVLLLVLSAAPDANSTGTVVGVVSIAELFRALAVGVSGISYYLADGQTLVVINGAMWATLVFTGLMGAVVTLKLRESPRVGADIPEECLVWEGMFDSESDDGRGF